MGGVSFKLIMIPISSALNDATARKIFEEKKNGAETGYIAYTSTTRVNRKIRKWDLRTKTSRARIWWTLYKPNKIQIETKCTNEETYGNIRTRNIIVNIKQRRQHISL
jgi:hypothetical protein